MTDQQATPPSDAERNKMLVAANGQLRVRLKEQEELKDTYREKAETLERQRDEARAEANKYRAGQALLEERIVQAAQECGELTDAAWVLHTALSETVAHISGYDWNADPKSLTLLQGKAFEVYTRVSSTQPKQERGTQ